jgi:hypothetical protein
MLFATTSFNTGGCALFRLGWKHYTKVYSAWPVTMTDDMQRAYIFLHLQVAHTAWLRGVAGFQDDMVKRLPARSFSMGLGSVGVQDNMGFTRQRIRSLANCANRWHCWMAVLPLGLELDNGRSYFAGGHGCHPGDMGEI